MVELTLTDGLILAVVGSSISASYAIANQIFALKYQYKLEMSRYKLQKLDKSSNDYILLGSYSRAIHELLCFPERPNEPCLFYACKFFHYYFKIVESNGFELDDLEAERTITDLTGDIIELTRRELSFESVYILSKSVTEKESYDEFIIKLKGNKIAISKSYYKFISLQNNRQKLHDYFLWLYKLLIFEVNYAYRVWYGKEDTINLDAGFRQYLSNKQRTQLISRIDGVNYKIKSTKKERLKRLIPYNRWGIHGD